jgi:DNA repair protein SbcD/Mre11
MAVKLLHTSDVHIGMENYGRINPATGLSTRLEDFCAVLDEAVERAIAEPVDVFVIAGDIYKTRDPTPTHQREFASRISRLMSAEIPVVIVPGNHDIPLSASRANSVEIFRTLDLAGVTVLRNIGRRTIQTRHGPLQVLGLPWVMRSAFLARDEYKNATLQELNQKMIELASDKLREEAEQLDPSQPAIVVAHAHVFGARVGAERLLTMGVDPVFELGVFSELPGVDYVALGHIHKHQALSHSQPPVVYSGSLNRVDFSEEKEQKGFVLADVERGACGWEFVPVKARPFLTIDVRTDVDDPTQKVLKAIFSAGEKVRESVVRLRIETTRAAALQLDQDEIRGQLREAFYLLPIQIEFLDADRERAIGRDFQGKTPLDLLQVYLEEKNVPADRRDSLAVYARALIDEPA